MKIRRILFALTMLISFSLLTLSCRETKSTEEKVEDTIEEVGDSMEEGAEEVEDAIEDGAEEVGDAVEDGAEEVEDAADDSI
ncbi:hypothetical protein AB8P51_13610 [Muriicola sp. SD30]|uniref:hypothetical protein n=1 Tax=Muriicola sp. SD30 TaxID=3240936 RepID=UPI00350FBDDA